MKWSILICVILGFLGIVLSLNFSKDVILHNFFTGIALVSVVSILFFLNKNQNDEIIK
jgi:hypothetical protein